MPDSTPQADDQLPISVRQDLQIAQTGVGIWTVKDPISEQFFQLREHDHFVFQQLREAVSVAEIQRRFFHAYAPLRLAEGQILAFIERLWTQGLILLERHGTAVEIERRAKKAEAAGHQPRLYSLLAIRFRGFDPDHLLEMSLPFVRWAFHPLAVGCAVVLILTAFLTAMGEWEAIARELPGMSTRLTTQHVLGLIAVVAFVKICHELGHAFACKHFGGDCHEMGIMLLVMTPCLYCNVSDAWRLKNRWQRIVISAAGMYVELVLAAACLFLWRWTVPGVMHSLCLYVVLVGSISTLLFNGNPLLRYDGYYILTDLIQIPNLRARAMTVVQDWRNLVLFGVRVRDPHGRPFLVRLSLGAYGVLSSIYLWGVLFGILWILERTFRHWGLQPIMTILVIFLVGQRLGVMGLRTLRTARVFHERRLSRGWRIGLGVALSLSGLIALFAVPMPRRISVPCLITSRHMRPVFVSTAGRLALQHVELGQRVEQGQALATLSDHELELRRLELQGDVDQQASVVNLLELQQVYDENASANLPTARSRLSDLQQQLSDLRITLDRLTMTAPVQGTIVGGEFLSEMNDTNVVLPIEGAPLDPLNDGVWLDQGTLICQISDETDRDAVLYVPQSEVAFITPGASVVLTTSQTAGKRFFGSVTSISPESSRQPPASIVAERLVPITVQGNSDITSEDPLHEVRVAIPQDTDTLVIDQTGFAVIILPNETLTTKLLRFIRRTLTFDLTE